MSKERTIGSNRHGGKVMLIEYEDDGHTYTDLFTDGRFLLDPQMAEQIALRLQLWAKKARGK